ncbi:hypothetical protein ACJMK2_001328, partial [Sinanodonta woodiana]
EVNAIERNVPDKYNDGLQRIPTEEDTQNHDIHPYVMFSSLPRGEINDGVAHIKNGTMQNLLKYIVIVRYRR